MSEKARGIRNWTILAVVIGLLAFSGLAMAQESTEADEGPPWAQEGFEDFKPGEDIGPPPWATGDDSDDGEGPPFVGVTDWTPGQSIGPPPWARGDGVDADDIGPPWTRPGINTGDWAPGTPGPPPWAGADDADGEGPPPWAGIGRGDGESDE